MQTFMKIYKELLLHNCQAQFKQVISISIELRRVDQYGHFSINTILILFSVNCTFVIFVLFILLFYLLFKFPQFPQS